MKKGIASILGSDLLLRYKELDKDVERLNEWRQNHIDTRETYLQMSNQLAQRRRQLISELSLIYSIRQVSSPQNGIELRN